MNHAVGIALGMAFGHIYESQVLKLQKDDRWPIYFGVTDLVLI